MTDNFEVCVCSNDILFSGNSNSMAKEMNSINKNNTHLAWVFRYFQRDILPDLPSCCHSKERILLQRKRASSILILPKKWFSFFVFASFNLHFIIWSCKRQTEWSKHFENKNVKTIIRKYLHLPIWQKQV